MSSRVSSAIISAYRVKRHIIVRQDGLCHFCRHNIEDTDEIVATGKNPRRYYHMQCTARLNIV